MSEPTLILAVTFVSLFLSSVAGYGGSLVLVPALAAIIGPKEGVALAALLLGWNNVFKVIAYRKTLALRQGWPLLIVTALGVWIGATLFLGLSSEVIVWAIVAVTVLSLVVELVGGHDGLRLRRHAAIPAMAASSVLSGVSGSSGPLKGISIRSLNLPRLEHVGVAASVSLVADALKVELFASAGLLRDVPLETLLIALPVMPVGAWLGRALNRRMSEDAFRWVFWTVVGGYTMRMVGVWF
ncbi:MAG: sulfite exporter TauE/SafE family protein [Ilumatobacteraceae bacterium]